MSATFSLTSKFSVNKLLLSPKINFTLFSRQAYPSFIPASEKEIYHAVLPNSHGRHEGLFSFHSGKTLANDYLQAPLSEISKLISAVNKSLWRTWARSHHYLSLKRTPSWPETLVFLVSLSVQAWIPESILLD